MRLELLQRGLRRRRLHGEHDAPVGAGELVRLDRRNLDLELLDRPGDREAGGAAGAHVLADDVDQQSPERRRAPSRRRSCRRSRRRPRSRIGSLIAARSRADALLHASRPHSSPAVGDPAAIHADGVERRQHLAGGVDRHQARRRSCATSSSRGRSTSVACLQRRAGILHPRRDVVGGRVADEELALPGAGDRADAVPRIGAGADHGAVADAAGRLVVEAAGRGRGREIAVVRRARPRRPCRASRLRSPSGSCRRRAAALRLASAATRRSVVK